MMIGMMLSQIGHKDDDDYDDVNTLWLMDR